MAFDIRRAGMAAAALAVAWCAASGVALAVGQATSAPRPFPGAPAPPSSPPRSGGGPATGSSGSGSQPSAPSSSQPAPAASTPPSGTPRTSAPSQAALNGAPVYPSAEFLDSYDAGRGQRTYLYGSDAAYLAVTDYYRKTLKSGGRELYRSPGVLQFDLGKFDDNTMAYPPSVVVKDYGEGESAGYLVVTGTSEKRFKTIIQIVPVPAATSR
jgi:hypothetical protein